MLKQSWEGSTWEPKGFTLEENTSICCITTLQSIGWWDYEFQFNISLVIMSQQQVFIFHLINRRKVASMLRKYNIIRMIACGWEMHIWGDCIVTYLPVFWHAALTREPHSGDGDVWKAKESLTSLCPQVCAQQQQKICSKWIKTLCIN